MHPSSARRRSSTISATASGGTSIRYASNRGYLGPDRFTYRIIDACGNVSEKATAFLQTIREVDLEDVFAVACAGQQARISIGATDLWIDPDVQGDVVFSFELLYGPTHGVARLDASSVRYTPPSMATDPIYGFVPTLTFIESSSIHLEYVPADGFVGPDAVRVLFSDPFGGVAIGNVDIRVIECGAATGSAAGIAVERGVPIVLIMPVTFRGVVEEAPQSVLLLAIDTGSVSTGAVMWPWSADLGRYVVVVDTASLTAGRYRLTIPLGNGELVSLVVEVGGGE